MRELPKKVGAMRASPLASLRHSHIAGCTTNWGLIDPTALTQEE